ncbi:MAG: hypothetical protein EOO10_22610, partial [Chitinophagaceae bacterium]
DDLRDRLDEITSKKSIYVYCQIGLRGYMASRILLQNGFVDVYNLSGGYRLWQASTNELEKLYADQPCVAQRNHQFSIAS